MNDNVQSGVSIRQATAGDAGRIAAMSAELGYPATLHEIKERLTLVKADASHAVFVAEVSPHDSVGWIHVSRLLHLESGRFAEIVGLVVSEVHRGFGIGRMLVGAAEEWASAKGCATIVVRSNVVREESRRFYERLGYPVAKQQNVFRKTIRPKMTPSA